MVAILALLDIPALTAVLYAVLALAGILIAWAAAQLFGPLIRAMASRIPVIGGFIGGVAQTIVNDVAAYGASWADGVIYPLVRIVVSVPMVAVATLDTVVGSFEWVFGQLIGAGGSILELAANLAYVTATVAAELLAHTGLIQALQGLVSGLQAGQTWIIETFVPGQIRDAITIAEADAGAALADVELTLSADISNLADAVSIDLAQLEASVGAIDGQLANEVWPAIDNLTGDMAGLLPLALPIAFPLVISRVVTLETTLTDVVTECVTPVCGFWGPQMGMLALLLDTATLALLVAFAGEAIANPDDTAKTVAGVASTLYQLGRDVLGPILPAA